MRATTIHATRDIRLSDVPDPRIEADTEAIVKVVAGCICGSDLWPYRGENDINAGDTIGHEAVGIVEEVGSAVTSFKPGDFVIVPFCHADNTCPHCLVGMHAVCDHLGFTESGQAEYTKVHQAEGSLVKTPGMPDAALIPSLLTLSDVMATGWHAAVSARVKPGGTAVVVGDGAVGLCGVLAAAHLGAERVIAMSRHEPRQAIARTFGATDIVAERGKEGGERIKELTNGIGADAVLECVGTDDSMKTAFADRPSRRDGRLRGRPARRGAAGPPDVPAQRRPGRRHGPGPRLPAAAARPGPRRHHQPGPGLRPDAAARPGRRGLPDDGRAPRHQGAAAAVTRRPSSSPLWQADGMSTSIDLGRPVSGDVIDLILDDHRRFETLLRQLRDSSSDRDAVRQAFSALHVAHALAEEEHVYPVLRRRDAITEHEAEHGEEEHAEGHEALLAVLELKGTDTDAFDDAVEELAKVVNHHLTEEELTILNPAREEVAERTRAELGEAFAAARNRHLDDDCGRLAHVRRIVRDAEKEGLLDDE